MFNHRPWSALFALFALFALSGCEDSSPTERFRDGLDERPSNPSCVAFDRPSGEVGIGLERVFGSLSPRRPVGLLQAPQRDDRWYLLERSGRILTFLDTTNLAVESFADLSERMDDSEFETGLLGMAFHPDFASNGWVFVSYVTRIDGRWRSRISRFSATSSRLDPNSERVVLQFDQPYANHNGGHLSFGPDGHLYASFGDGGDAGDPGRRGQDRSNLFGTFIRIDVDQLPYRVPTDNPFVDEGSSNVRPEIWAYGFRNPWRFSFDRSTGTLWTGDVGQERREEVDIVQAGGNYGWSELEGSLCFRSSECSVGDTILPVAEYGHDEGISITGGFVYRGRAIPELEGVYLYADFGTGILWGLFENPRTGQREPRTLLSTGLSISAFGESNDGEIYLLGYGDSGSIHRLVPRGSSPQSLPERLSETGCFDSERPDRAAGGLIEYEVSAPLWSDGARKRRWVAIPDDAQTRVLEDGRLELPVGAVLVKEFERDRRKLETRFLVRHDDGDWAGYTYVWNDDQSDAVLARSGSTLDHAGRSWSVPSRGQCLQCHTAAAGRVLGFRTEQLERAGDGRLLDDLAEVGWLDRPMVDGRPPPLPRLDSDAPLSERARAYLDGNCAGCHRPGGPGRGPMDLRHATAFPLQGLCDGRPANGDLGIANARIFAPGSPERSVLLARMSRRGLGQMPPLGTHDVDPAGTALIREWIRATGECEGSDWRRTVVFLRFETRPGQDIFLRGGLDHDAARQRLGLDCQDGDLRCAVPIRHRIAGRGEGDTFLDWYGAEFDQPRDTVGTPMVWTTDAWPDEWGPRRTVDVDGYGESGLNDLGPHYWMLDVDMDCARTIDGWFELKAFVTNGPGWEPDISADGPYESRNHFARCGEVTVLSWGTDQAATRPLP